MKNKKLGFKKTNLDNSAWITNFWFVNETLFLTESLFDENQNFFGYLNYHQLEDNLLVKRISSKFLHHPDPLTSSALLSSISEIKPIFYLQDFIYNVFFFENKYYLAFIDQNKEFGYTKVFDKNFEELEIIEDYLIIGKVQNNLVYLNFYNKQSYVYQDKKFIDFDFPNLKKILNFEEFDLLISDKEVYKMSNLKQIEKVYQSEFSIQVSKFNDKIIFISLDKLHQTISFDLTKREDQTKMIDRSYFFKLESINQKILLGKPLYLNNQYEDYSLDLVVIK